MNEQNTNVIAIPEDGVPPEKWLRIGPAMARQMQADLAALRQRVSELEEELKNRPSTKQTDVCDCDEPTIKNDSTFCEFCEAPILRRY